MRASLLERAVVRALPLAPPPLVQRVAARYVAGEELDDALRVTRELAAGGMRATIDLLGEEIVDDARAEATAEEFVRALDALRAAGLPAGVSVKLSALGIVASEEAAAERLRRIVEAAAADDRFVRIDMEDARTTDATLRVYARLRAEGYANVGVVLQSMLRRTLDDARALVRSGIADVRICKGIYLEPFAIAYQDPELVRRSFTRVAEEVLSGGGRIAAATHDERLIESVGELAERHDPLAERHEYQMLLGVARPLRDLLVARGAGMRVYVPYGAESIAYARRRLAENPRLLRHVVSAFLGERRG
jgi:proline dehydrogenase